MDVWEHYGITVKPFFVTPYPGSEWFHIYRDKILEQYGSMDDFLSDLGDATDISAVICENFDAVELYGLRQLMMNSDYKRVAIFEKKWRTINGDPLDGVNRALKKMQLI